jgi:type IV secretory pathway VirD2 relaxase
MADADDEFRPRLGRIRSAGGRASKRYIGKLYAAVEKAKPGAFTKRSGGGFTGARLGRGAGLGAAFAMRNHPFAKFRSRRVAVKIRSVRFGAHGLPKAQAHLNYIQRDGASRERGPSDLYGPAQDHVDGGDFLEDGKNDRHQFRIILSPEDAGDLQSLNQFTRDVMASAEKDLGTRLDWVAVNHFHTDHPHVHIVLRGRSDDGRDLVIAKSYITHGFRRRAEELATLELGPRRDLDIARSRAAEVEREAFTGLDRDLLRRAVAGPFHLDQPQTPYDRFETKLLASRLQTLQKMALARRESDGWRLAPDMENRLRAAGRRGDIIRSMGAELGDRLAPHAVRDFSEDKAINRIVGRVGGIGSADDSHDRRFLAIEGADGHQWHAAIDLPPGVAPPRGAVIELTRMPPAPRKSDATIAAIADRHGGHYSDEFHAGADASATVDFRLAHKRRLEALRRAGIVDRNEDGTWRVPKDFLERAAAHEAERSLARIRVLSWVALEQLPGASAETFLDDALEKRVDIDRVPHGFGAELGNALAARRRWLFAQGIGREGEEGFAIDRDRLRSLTRGAIEGAAGRISRDLGKSVVPARVGDRIEGVYRRPIDTAQGRFALIERSKEFTLVPWRDVLEQRRGMEVSGIVRGSGINWDLGRGRSGPAR